MSETIVIKIGGVASQSLSDDFLNQVKAWQEAGKQLVIVHGGGYAINQLMEAAGLPIEKKDGLRVTSQKAMTLVAQGLQEIVAPNLKESLEDAGLPILIFKEELTAFQSDFLNKEDYGYVGQVPTVDSQIFQNVFGQGKIPLIPSLAYAPTGELLNINADHLATAVAKSLLADQLILMTDVPGVKEGDRVLPVLTFQAIAEKIASGIITGGMIPKVESAQATVQAGVGQVLIGSDLTTGTIVKAG